MSIKLKDRSFLKLIDHSPKEIHYLINLAFYLKEQKIKGNEGSNLERKNIVLVFEKTSTRTRCAFEVATLDQGGHVTYLGPNDTQMGHKESMKDTARVLGRMYDGIEYRGYSQECVEILAKYSNVPVWNGLTNEFHPTQILADLMTMKEHLQKPFNQMKLCYIGNAQNNVSNSLMLGAAMMGIDFRIAAPKKYQPKAEMIEQAQNLADENGGHIQISEDIGSMVQGVDFLYTDVWVSLGESEDVWEERITWLKPYQVNRKVMEMTGNPDVAFLHCLPAFHDQETLIAKKILERYGIEEMEVTNDVFESSSSLVFDEAENRVHTAKAVMVASFSDPLPFSLAMGD